MTTLVSNVTIPTPARYMARLAKHFEHRVPVERDETTATIRFPPGPCVLVARESVLELRLDVADAEARERLQEVVTRHLKQVASQESFDVEWQAA
jgi:hypothetical protein